MRRTIGMLSLLVSTFPASAHADCFSDCMGQCWSGRSDENISYCSGTEARCESECRSGGGERRSYGAIAYSVTDGAFGFSDHWPSQVKAEEVALEACKENGPGCEVTVWFVNSCGAVSGSGTLVAWGQDGAESAARSKALRSCEEQGGKKCNIKVSHCSR